MLRLHYFSDNPALAVEDDEETVYSIDLIKEFEAVGLAWKAFLTEWLLEGAGLFMSPTRCASAFAHSTCCCLRFVFVVPVSAVTTW